MSISISTLFENGQVASVRPKQALFRTGDPVRSMFLVVEGQIDLVRHTRTGTLLILNRVDAGNVLAEASAYSRTYHCDGVAGHASQVRSISVSEFNERLKSAPDAAHSWARHLAHCLQDARMNSEIRTLKTVSERLDAWLGANGSLPPKGQFQDLAFVLGVSREALYRELARRRRGITGHG